MDAGFQIDIDTAQSFPDFFVPGLEPYGLARVPGWRPMPGVDVPKGWRPTPGEPGFEDPAWRIEHQTWAAKIRDVVRPWIHERGKADPEFAALERIACAADPNYFGIVYGWIYEPKPMAGEAKDKPYTKFAYQCDNTALMHDWVHRPWTDQAKIWRSKSRQLGISWDDETYDTHFYLFQDGSAKLTSRSEDWVDKGNSTEAMFGKVKYLLRKIAEHTPYLLPEGYTITNLLSPPHYRHMVLINPVSGTALYGESANKRVGRGGTYTFGRADEDASILDLEETLSGLESCPRVFLASTESFEISMEHFDGWQSAKRERPETVREYNWHQNAYLDLAWEQKTLASATNDEQLQRIYREYFRDPFRGASTWVYPEARAIPEVDRRYDRNRPLDITMDPAGSGDDFALLAAQAHADQGQEGFHVLWTFEERLPNPLRIAHIATGIWPQPGDACYPWEPGSNSKERQIGDLFYDLWINGHEVRWFMDPAGDQVHSGASFFIQFRDLTRTLREREAERLTIAAIEAGQDAASYSHLARPIVPRFKALKDKRLFGDREYAFRRYLPHVTVQTGVTSAIRARECAAMTSYNALTKAAITEPKRKHDQYSHLASCLENYSLYYKMGFIDPLDLRAASKKLGLDGLQRAIPSGFRASGVPKTFGKKPALPPSATPLRPPPPGNFLKSPGGFR